MANDETDVPPGESPGSQRRRIVFYGICALFVVAVLYATLGVLLPFVLAIVVAYVLAPLVSLLERVRIGRFRMPRWTAVVLIYAALIGLLSALFAVGVPRLVVEIERLAGDAPRMVATVRDEWLPELERQLEQATSAYAPEPGEPDAVTGADAGETPPPPTERITPGPEGAWEVQLPPRGILVTPEGNGYRIHTRDRAPGERRHLTETVVDAFRSLTENTAQHTGTIIQTAQNLIRAVVKGVFTFSIMLMLSAFMLATSERIFGFMRSLVAPRRRVEFDSLLARIDRGLSGVVRGQLIIAVINGVLSGIGFYLADLRYWPVLTLIATLLSIIPIFGAIISTIPAVIVGLQDGIGTALFVLLWIIGIHQIEANLLNPKIMGDQARVHPALVVFALLAGEHLGGIAGALLAVPVLSIVQSLFLHFRDAVLGPPTPASPEARPPPP